MPEYKPSIVSLLCPNPRCQAKLKANTGHADRQFRCPHCRTPITVPGGGEPVTDADSAVTGAVASGSAVANQAQVAPKGNVCRKCGAVLGAGQPCCQECGTRVPSEPSVVVEVETDRPHVQGHACQLRFRITHAGEEPCQAALEMHLVGSDQHIEQKKTETEQYCRLEQRREQITLSFPFRPLIPGEFPVESLRLAVGLGGDGDETYLWQLPGRSLFVQASDPNQASAGPSINIEGGIKIDLSQLTELYGADIKNLINLNAGQDSQTGQSQPAWQVIALHKVGTETRGRCTAARCDRFVPIHEISSCGECGSAVCSQHVDGEYLGCCANCAEDLRIREFQEKKNHVTESAATVQVVDQVVDISQPAAPFQGRIWTDAGARPTTRDIGTVRRDSHACFRIGQEFTLNVQADRDCHLTLLDIGTSGNTFLLLQNHPLRAGKPVDLSGPDDSHMWVVGGPPGIERIKAFFTVRPVDLFPGMPAFSPLAAEGNTREILTKVRAARLRLDQLPSDSWTDATCQFSVENPT